MKNHTAYGLDMEDLDIVIVDDSRPMQSILRSILLSFKVARVRCYDSVDDALSAMTAEPPNLILSDWRMAPTSGYQLLRLIRHRHMEPLCFVPLLFVTAHGTRALVDRALRSGAHHLLVKPVSPSTLYKRLRWIMADDRPMVLDNSGFYNVHGIQKAMDAQRDRKKSLVQTQVLHDRSAQSLVQVRGTVDKEFDKTASGQNKTAGTKTGRGFAAPSRVGAN